MQSLGFLSYMTSWFFSDQSAVVNYVEIEHEQWKVNEVLRLKIMLSPRGTASMLLAWGGVHQCVMITLGLVHFLAFESTRLQNGSLSRQTCLHGELGTISDHTSSTIDACSYSSTMRDSAPGHIPAPRPIFASHCAPNPTHPRCQIPNEIEAVTITLSRNTPFVGIVFGAPERRSARVV